MKPCVICSTQLHLCFTQLTSTYIARRRGNLTDQEYSVAKRRLLEGDQSFERAAEERYGMGVDELMRNMSLEWDTSSRDTIVPQAAPLAPVSVDRLPPNNVITF
jgi:hypothetical protein